MTSSNYSAVHQDFYSKMAMDTNQPEIYVKLFVSLHTGITVCVIEDLILKSLDLWHKTEPAKRSASHTLAKSTKVGSPLEWVMKNDGGSRRILEGLFLHEISRSEKDWAERATSVTQQDFYSKMAMDTNQPEIYVKLFVSLHTGITVCAIDDLIQKSLDLWHKTESAKRAVTLTLAKSTTVGTPLDWALKSDEGSRRILEGLLCHEISMKKREWAERARSVPSSTKKAQPHKPIKKRDICMISDEEDLMTTA